MIAEGMRVGQGILPVDGELRMVGGTGGPARDALGARLPSRLLLRRGLTPGVDRVAFLR